MVNSALYNKLTTKGGRPMRNTGPHAFNLMVGGQKARGSSSSSFLNLLNDKKEFLIKVFANLIAQLGITYYFMMNYKADPKNTGLYWGLVIVQFILIITLALVPMPSWLKVILFSLFSVIAGYLLSILKQVSDPKLIQTAILGTMSIFGVMFLFGATLIMFGVKLGLQFAAFLFYALLLLIIVQIVTIFSGATTGFMKGLTIFSLILFSIYIIYDTNNILQREYSGDFITASLDYYLDIINVFVDLVGLLGNNN
jgi:FtsH-binding integral membrane protein